MYVFHTLSSSLSLILFSFLFVTGYSEVRLTQQSPLDLPCSGAEVVFQCTLPGGVVIWSFPAEITMVPTNNEVVSGNFRARPVGVANGEFTSTLTFPASNEIVIICSNGERNMNDTLSVTVRGPPSVPTLSSIDLSGDVSGAVNITVSWTLSGGDSADFYLISITTNAPQTPYGGLLNITTASVTQYELTGFMTGYEYNITVRGINCGSQEGRESEPLTIRLQVPAVPSSCNITLSYDQLSGRLLFINSSWDTVPNPVDPDPGEACPGPSGDITLYQIRFRTGSVVATENVNVARCTAGRCSHSFEPPSNPPSSYDSVSVAAENMAGVGAARTCTVQTISTTNNVLRGEVVGVSSPVGAQLQCTFLSGFNGSACCTVQYGTDPTYMNLPYSAESTETGTAGNSVSVVLRERLNSSTVYYYTVSAVSGDVSVTVRGTFTTPQYNCPLSELLMAGPFLDDNYPQCQQDQDTVTSITITNGVVNVTCYSGRQFVSVASHVCDEGYQPNVTSSVRVCRDNGLWSGTTIVCDSEPTTLSTADTISTGAAVGITAVVTALIALFVGVLVGALLFYCISKHRSQRSKLSSHQQQQAAVPQQRAGPEYEEVVELKENTAYGPVQSIELKACEAYVPVQH